VIATSRYAPLLVEAFADILGKTDVQSATRWDLTLSGTPIIAQHDDSWLVMTAPATAAPALPTLLGWNASLPGRVKFALTENGDAQIRAEIPLDDDSEPLIHEAWHGFATALALLHGEASQLSPVATAVAVAQEELKRLCDEAEWPCTPRGDGSCAVELECPGAFLQASLTPHGDGVRVSVQIASCDELAVESVSALGVLFLKVGAAVRMARPVFETGEGKVLARFEVTFSAVPAAAHLAHALSALSVAAQFGAEEARVLQEPDVAREFLALSKTTTRKEET
jgi:hypothetical protein